MTFNWRIVMAPRRLIEYVTAHEACHLIHNNHSQGFWRLLARVMPDCETRRIELAVEGAKFQL
ncbi:M48 metallopeptidase family protein [Neorhodopirellula lusitana]|uniref:M48 metallopeptidase family protein n=1 Tax=Neorhodopirellula lusitana TaxID=445327 RepID=UPI00384BFB59